MDRLTELETQLKHAAESLQYEAVERIAPQYGDEARSVLALLTGREAGSTVRRVAMTLEWARQVVLTGRAVAAEEARRLPAVKGFLQSLQTPHSSLHLDL